MTSLRPASWVLAMLTVAISTGCQTPPIQPTLATESARPDKVGAPVLQSVTLRYNVPDAQGIVVSVIPDLHFVAPNGNVIVLRREVVETTASTSQLHVNPT